MRAIIELIGEQGVGKTTLSNVLGEELAPANILLIDASTDARLTHMLAPQPPQLTLGQLFRDKSIVTGAREAVDWAFHDLLIPAGEAHELISVGALDATLPKDERNKLQYGLTRLLDAYDYVIVDGYHPLLHAMLPTESLRMLMVLGPGLMTPDDPPGWLSDEARGATPAVIVNRDCGEAFPPALEEALLAHRVRLVGKLPRYATAEDCLCRLPDDFRNCLLRLDIPLNFNAA